jgi:hypothetical protein
MIRKFAAAAAAWMLASAGYCMDGVAVEIGTGDDDTRAIRLAGTWNWRKQWQLGEKWHLAGYWELSLGAWENLDDSTTDFGFTPVFRFEHHDEHHVYVEAAIGFHILSQHISAQRQFSTNFQFGDHLAVGARFGSRRRYDLGVRLQHISNGGIQKPNPGINFLLLRFQYNLE